ncbi:PASTA domain-containing protein [Vagococcus silagei]|uniref:PASTA domain-containing protein n=1 Tax=Vagococcus silagei TaxID=2508885 RepID=A0A4S3B0S5_9ENTE|nr:PASTA domain-containing protein [Vagococcus silagei]THB60372.1 hypothetical protein ESZ54_11035 [Vagococcus silagei]
MKRKKSKYNKMKTGRTQKIVYLIYLIIIAVSCFLFFRAYQYISNIPKANNITQEEIYDLTKIGESDIKLVRALKNDAFDSWLYEANSDKVKKLPKIQEIISSITDGKVKVSDIDQVITGLKKEVGTINDSDVEELYVIYYKAILPKHYEKADYAFQQMTVSHPDDYYQDIFSLLDLLNKIYVQKGMLIVTNDINFKKATSLLNEINKNFIEVNQIKSSVMSYSALTEPIPDPQTRLGRELDTYVYKANDYLQSNLMVNEFKKKYQELQDNLEINRELIKKSVELPDLVGLTVEEAHQELTKLKLNYSVYGFTNRLYKNGALVPESKRGNEHWDNDKKDRIIRQDPSSSSYDYIIQDTTIKITVENKAVEKPIESTDSSSTTSSDSSSSTIHTTSTTTVNFDK